MRVVRLDNETGAATPLPDVLTGVKYSTTAWTPDNKARTFASFSFITKHAQRRALLQLFCSSYKAS